MKQLHGSSLSQTQIKKKKKSSELQLHTVLKTQKAVQYIFFPYFNYLFVRKKQRQNVPKKNCNSYILR